VGAGVHPRTFRASETVECSASRHSRLYNVYKQCLQQKLHSRLSHTLVKDFIKLTQMTNHLSPTNQKLHTQRWGSHHFVHGKLRRCRLPKGYVTTQQATHFSYMLSVQNIGVAMQWNMNWIKPLHYEPVVLHAPKCCVVCLPTPETFNRQ